MAAVSYSFCMAILHSIWQGALLWLLYTGISRMLPKNQPLAKRNLLFVSLTAQLALFAVSFLIYFLAPATSGQSALISIGDRLLADTNIQLITPWLFGLYLLILAVKTTRAFSSWYYFRKMYRSGLLKPGIDLRLFTEQKAHQFGIKRKVTLWFSNTINTPITFGFFRPVILLPVALVNQISLQQAETLILHELTHIRSNDYLLNWVIVIAENILFFNPFVKHCCRQIKLEREKHCDLSVMAFNYPVTVYAETLLHAERTKQQLMPAFQLAAVQHKKQLLHRIRFFSTHTPAPHKGISGLIVPALLLLLHTLAMPAVLMQSVNRGQAGESAYSQAPIAGISTINIEATPLFTNNVDLPEISLDALKKITAAVEKSKPVIEKKLAKLQPLIRDIAHKAQELTKDLPSDFVVPVAEKEIDSIGSQIIIQEEVAGTNGTAVKVYQMIYRNGQWVMVPEWMASARQIPETITKGKQDSTGKKLLPPQ